MLLLQIVNTRISPFQNRFLYSIRIRRLEFRGGFTYYSKSVSYLIDQSKIFLKYNKYANLKNKEQIKIFPWGHP